ncbi:MAG: transposase [Nitrospirota bacterium]|nr:transposase [Nitrospirota bacterium]
MKSDDSMTTTSRRRYTEEFKVEAVRLVHDAARPVAQVARDLDIADHLLYRWRAEQQQAERHGHSRQSMREEQEELARLRRENAMLKQDRDFLKRAAAFFAKESR